MPKVMIQIEGEAAERWSEFEQYCGGRIMTPSERIANLVLGDILTFEKLSKGY